ncbi:hypothetical protein [Pseudobacillus badius]|uniref:hypothetical protein n=1 Tax=Bacillus badius TaxID=1455 RepID=UPI003D34F9D2
MSKQHIEFILNNEEHLRQLKRLSKLWNEYIDYVLKGVEFTSDGVSIADSKEHDKAYIQTKFEKLIGENYFIDPDCDPYGVIEDGLLSARFMGDPAILLSSIKKEQEKRHTRKRHPKKSWEKLRAIGLEP